MVTACSLGTKISSEKPGASGARTASIGVHSEWEWRACRFLFLTAQVSHALAVSCANSPEADICHYLIGCADMIYIFTHVRLAHIFLKESGWFFCRSGLWPSSDRVYCATTAVRHCNWNLAFAKLGGLGRMQEIVYLLCHVGHGNDTSSIQELLCSYQCWLSHVKQVTRQVESVHVSWLFWTHPRCAHKRSQFRELGHHWQSWTVLCICTKTHMLKHAHENVVWQTTQSKAWYCFKEDLSSHFFLSFFYEQINMKHWNAMADVQCLLKLIAIKISSVCLQVGFLA